MNHEEASSGNINTKEGNSLTPNENINKRLLQVSIQILYHTR